MRKLFLITFLLMSLGCAHDNEIRSAKMTGEDWAGEPPRPTPPLDEPRGPEPDEHRRAE